jgi:hypothetical protein
VECVGHVHGCQEPTNPAAADGLDPSRSTLDDIESWYGWPRSDTKSEESWRSGWGQDQFSEARFYTGATVVVGQPEPVRQQQQCRRPYQPFAEFCYVDRRGMLLSIPAWSLANCWIREYKPPTPRFSPPRWALHPTCPTRSSKKPKRTTCGASTAT